MRLGDARWGAALMLAGPVTSLVVAAVLWFIPAFGYAAYWGFAIVMLAGVAAWAVAAIVLTWRASVERRANPPWWTRWYAPIGMFVLAQAAVMGAVGLARASFHLFYSASESMIPTLLVNDQLLGDMRNRTAPRRGELILLTVRGDVWIKRLIAIGGDRVAVRGGVPIINGVPATQRQAGSIETSGLFGTGVIRARRFIETLPGESASHAIIDKGVMPSGEDMPEIVVPRGRLFVMGDNRDNSADSRFDIASGGTGLPRVEDIVGRPLFVFTSSGPDRAGARLDAGVEPLPRTR